MDSHSGCLEKPISRPDVGLTSPKELQLTVYEPHGSTNGFEALRDEWNGLLRRSRANTIFLTYEWQTTWWDNLGEGDLWILAFRKAENGELVGIVPLYLVQSAEGRRQFTLVGCIEVSDYLDVIVEIGWETPVYSTLIGWLDSDEAPAWDIVDLCNLPEESLTYRSLPSIAAASGHEVSVKQEDVAPQFHLPADYESYLQETVDKKQRHEIRRKQRRAERETRVGFHLVDDSQVLAAEVEDFIALQRASREDKADFMTAEMRHFFYAAALRMQEAGFLRLFFLTLDGEKAATLLAFEYDRKFLLYNSGYDPEAHAHLSPGWVLLAYAIQYAIVAGCQLFDFMQGDEGYKYRFGSRDYKVMRVIIER